MRSRRGAGRAAAAVALAAAALACAPAPPATSRVQRFPAQPGQTRLVQLGREAPGRQEHPDPSRRWSLAETRPALERRMGEPLAWELDAPQQSRLAFAAAVRGSAPEGSRVEVRVDVGGVTVHRERFWPFQAERWRRVVVALPRSGRLRVSLAGELLDRAGPVALAREAAPRLLVGSLRVLPATPPARRRLLVWLSQDTVRADHLSLYGYDRATTPHFAKFGRGWSVFENATAPASWTLPSLASQFTSRYPSFHGAVAEGRARDRRQTSLFEVLAREGFTVLGVSGNPFVSDVFGMAEGFDGLWYTEGAAEDVNRLAFAALEEWGGEDLALFVHYQDPHHPYAPPAPFDRLFDAGGSQALDSRDPAAVERTKALYDAEIAYTDRAIHALLRQLRVQRLLDDAVIAYTADHGEEFLDHGAWAHARTVYGELLHVPFAIGLPGLAARRIGEVVSLVDLAPTVLDAFGIAAPPSFQGRSLMPLLRGRPRAGEPVFAETQRNLEKRHLVAVRDGSLKYILATHPGLAGPPEILREELYDLAADPRERRPRPLGAEGARLRQHALAFLARAAEQSAGAQPAALTPELEERLRALGYLF